MKVNWIAMQARRKIHKLIISAFFIVVITAQLFADETGIVSGVIRDGATGKGLPGVNVQVVGTFLGASTQKSGEFRIERIPAGNYDVKATMIGYKPGLLKNISVRSNEQIEITISLEETVINFDPLIVTASKTQRELDKAPSSVSVLSAPEIRERNPLRMDQVLETIPGVNFVRDQVNIRGSTGFTIGAANRTLLLLDGVPVMTSDTGQFNWDMLPVLDIEQIEVVKGAGSALWGTAALGGVINIITKSATEQGKTLVRLTAGEYDELRYDEWKWTNRPLTFGRFDVSHSQLFGAVGLRLSAGRHISTGYTEVDDFRRWNFTGKLDYNFKNGSTWTVYGSYNYDEAGIYVGWDDPQKPFEVKTSNENSRGEIKMASLYTRYHWIISPKAALKFRLSYIMSLMGSQFVTSTDFNPAKGLGGEIQGDLLPMSNMELTYGVELKWDTGNTKYFGDHKGYTVGLYSQLEYKLANDKLRLSPGIRYDQYKLIDGLSQDLVSPRFGINYKPFQNTIIRASAGSGFRAATIAERFLDFESTSVIVESNPDLKAETSWSYDFGWRQYLSKNWFVELGAFRNDFDNLIEIDLKQSQIEFAQDIRVSVKFQNLLQARIEGLEFTTGGTWWRNRLRLNATATVMDHEDLVTHQALTYRPKVIAFVNPSIRLGAWEFHADYRYASRIEAVKLFRYDERVPQKVVNFRLLYHLGNIDIQCAINNALDYYYTQIERNMGEIRNFTAGITAEF